MRTIQAVVLLVSLAPIAAAAELVDEVQNAAKSLHELPNYSWKSTVNNLVPNSRFRQGPTEGKTEKGGFTTISMTLGDNTLEAVIKGDKGAVKTPEGWRSLAEMQANTDQQNAGRFMGRALSAVKTPAEQALDLAGKTYGLRKIDDAIGGDLNQAALKQLLTFGRRPGNDTAEPMLRDTAGTVKFWVKDGVLAKLEITAKGIVSFGGGERTVDRVTTIEIKDVGTTKVEVSDEAKGKAS